MSIANQVHETLRNFIKDASPEDQSQLFKAIQFGLDLPIGLSSLSPLVDSLGLTTINDLIYIHTEVDVGPEQLQLTTVEFQTLLKKVDQKIGQSITSLWDDFWFLGTAWPPESDIYDQARNLLDKVLQVCLQTGGKFEWAVAIALFFKLLIQDDTIFKKIGPFFSALEQAIEKRQIPDWGIAFGLAITSQKRAKLLIDFMDDEDEMVRLGAAAFWATAIDASTINYGFPLVKDAKIKWVQEICFDWELSISLLQSEQTLRRQQGIKLLTFSNYLITEISRRQLLLDMMMNSKSSGEDKTWSEFLTRFPIQENQEPHWCKLLEYILAYPQGYSDEILSGAVQRYQEMMKDKDIDLLEQNEARLGLP